VILGDTAKLAFPKPERAGAVDLSDLDAPA